MKENNYDKISLQLSTAAKEVAEETMKEAREELRQAPSSDNSSVIDTEVSCDGTWQRRGFSSLNDIVAAISMKTGKICDIEAMSRTSKACNLKEKLKKEDPLAYANWKEIHVCNFNYRGSAGNMVVVGQKEYGNGQWKKINYGIPHFTVMVTAWVIWVFVMFILG